MERASVFFAFLRVRFAVYSRALLVDPDGHGAVVCQRYLHIGAEATRTDGATESLLKGANDLAVEGFGNLGAGGDVVGIHSQFVHRLPDEEEGCVDPIIDLFFLFVEQVFAEYPFLSWLGFFGCKDTGFLCGVVFTVWRVACFAACST